MTFWEGIVTIIGAALAGAGGGFGFIKFLVARKDKKEEKNTQTIVDKAIEEAKKEIYDKLSEVSMERSEEGANRFNLHAESLTRVNRQIAENSKQISELTEISKNVLTSMESMNRLVKASAESQRNANYDRLLIVGKKVLASKQITISEKTNIKQLYDSYKELMGSDAYIDTLYEECMRLTPVPDAERG